MATPVSGPASVRTTVRSREPLVAVLYAAIAVLLGFAFWCYKLRVGFSDAPFYIVNMAAKDGFEVAHGRYICLLIQWLPVLLIKLDAPLKWVAVAYSVCYSLAPVLMALVALRWLRQPRTALAILLLVTLMNSKLFYYPVSDFQLGLALLLLYNGIFEHCRAQSTPRWRVFGPASLIVLPTLAFAHPLVLPVYAVWIAYRAENGKRDLPMVAVAALGFAAAYAAKRLAFTSGYEAVRAADIPDILSFSAAHYSGWLSQTFGAYLWKEAFLVPALLLGTIALAVARREWFMLLWVVGGTAALYSLVLLAFQDLAANDAYDHYHEHCMQAALFPALLVFPRLAGAWRVDARLKAATVASVFLISFGKIADGGRVHRERQAWYTGCIRLMNSLHVDKAIVGRAWLPDGWTKGTFWSAPMETLFLSALDNPRNAKTLFMPWDIRTFQNGPYNRGDVFLFDGYYHPLDEVTSRYFPLSARPYVILEDALAPAVLNRLRWP